LTLAALGCSALALPAVSSATPAPWTAQPAAAGADVLAGIYGNDFSFTVTSPALPGVTRSFVSFSEAAQEASMSRIYNSNHRRLDEVAGENLGHDIAGFVLARDLPKGIGAH
jgi:hypothetical protein